MDTLAEGDRLESWKEIAAFLNRDVRTVQRWERREGLPVRRHQHDKLASVYAYRSELRAWQASRTAAAPPLDASEPPPLTPAVSTSDADVERVALAPGRKGLTASVALAAALVLALAGWLSLRPAGSVAPPQAGFTFLVAHPAVPPELVSVALPLKVALAARLAEAGGQPLSAADVRRSLALMRQPPDPPALLADAAREVALRRGGVHLIVEPRVDVGGDKFLLSLAAWGGPEAREELARATTHVSSSGATVTEFDVLVRRVLEQVRASSVVPTRGLPYVTTKSLRAARLFAEADALMRRSLWDAAIPLLRDAVEADPQFASAHNHLAWVYHNTSRPSADVRRLLDRAMQLRDGVSELERWFITGSFHELTGRRDDAMAAYERVLDSDPQHGWALGNLSNIKSLRGEHATAADLLIRLASATPTSPLNQMHAADVSATLGRRDDSRRFRQNAITLLGGLSPEHAEIPESWLPYARACDAWERGDVTAVSAIADELRRRLGPTPGQPGEIARLGLLLLDLGRTRLAEEVFEMAAPAPDRLQFLAMAAAARSDRALARRRLLEFSRTFEQVLPATGTLLVDMGLVEEADRLLARWDREGFWPDHLLSPFRASLRSAHGDVEGANRLLGAALPLLEKPDLSWMRQMLTSGMPYLDALQLHATLAHEGGRPGDAIATLERAEIERLPLCTAHQWNGSRWLVLRQQLAALHRHQGNVDRALAIERDLMARLALADDDHAVLVALRAAAN